MVLKLLFGSSLNERGQENTGVLGETLQCLVLFECLAIIPQVVQAIFIQRCSELFCRKLRKWSKIETW